MAELSTGLFMSVDRLLLKLDNVYLIHHARQVNYPYIFRGARFGQIAPTEKIQEFIILLLSIICEKALYRIIIILMMTDKPDLPIIILI